MENPAILLRRLNPYCVRAMEGAASLCQTRAHAEIQPEHWLLKLLGLGKGDLTVLACRYDEEQIRSVHLLMAFREDLKLLKCDGLWQLLTLIRASWNACDRCSMHSQMNVRRCRQKNRCWCPAGAGTDTDANITTQDNALSLAAGRAG